MIRTGGGSFDPTEGPCYFLPFVSGFLSQIAAGLVEQDPTRLLHRNHDHILIAVNELRTGDDFSILDRLIGDGKKILLDSGIFNLTMEHARAHTVPMDQALALAPDEIDGFAKLFDRYVTIAKEYGDRVWGYVELDQGGHANKLATREKLHALGLRPIPVYHPLNDGWEYFDELASQYDRLCFGNVVYAQRYERKRLIATAWERHRQYPDLWIHMLGLTPNEWLDAFPVNSADSSTWAKNARFGELRTHACTAPFGEISREFMPAIGQVHSWRAGIHMATYNATMLERNWRTYHADMAALGMQKYPAPTERTAA